jgi:F420-dependent oxidoreductase-like protein
MKLGLCLGLVDPQNVDGQMDLAVEADRLGYDSCWFGEVYGSDCFTPITWVGSRTSRIRLGTSILQLSARTPTSAAMTAVTIDLLSKGRLSIGVGASGPQVVEGWYGQPYPRPLERTREWITIFRQIVERAEPLVFHGKHYDIPHPGGTGLGKPLKLMIKPHRPRIPLYLGAEGPKNVALAAELCEGWLPMFISPYRMNVYDEALAAASPDFDIAAVVQVNIGDDLEACLAPVRQNVGFYIGGMGAKTVNLHKNHVTRLGFGEAAERVQDLFLAGRRDEAYAAVPVQLADEISLCGPWGRIRERLQDWKQSRISSLLVQARDVATLRLFAEALL